jgi:hypothetical protein
MVEPGDITGSSTALERLSEDGELRPRRGEAARQRASDPADLGRLSPISLCRVALPLLVALSEIGLQSGTMLPENAAALVGAGVLSVLIFPAIATSIHRRRTPWPETVADSDAAGPPGDQPPTARV